MTYFQKFGRREEIPQNRHIYKDAEREAGKDYIVITKSKPPVREGLRSRKGCFPQYLFMFLF